MKNKIPFAIFSALLATGSHAAPFMAVGDGAELFVTGTLGVRADDNIFLDRKATSDTVFDINPGLELTFGKDAQLKGALSATVAFANYSSNTNLNTVLFSSDFGSKYDDGKLKLGFNLGFHEVNQNSVDIRGLNRRDVFTSAGNTEVEISQITSVGAGISFQHENFKRKTFGDTDTLTVPIDFFYKWTEKVDLSFGYQYRDYQTTVGQDSNDHFFNLGARGEFTPKFNGKIQIGLSTRKLAKGSDETLLGFTSNFNYELTAKTSLQFGGSNDFGTTPSGAQQKNLSANVAATTKLTEDWSVNAGLSWRAIDSLGHTDDYIEGTLGATYVMNANVRFVGSYVYRNNSSPLSTSEFSNNAFSVSASIRY